MANLILASKREVKNGSQMWHVYRYSENTKSDEFFFAQPIKALRYCFLLRKRSGAIIPKAIYTKLMADVSASKAQAENNAPVRPVDGDIARFHKETDSSGRTAIDEANYNADALEASLLVDGKKSHIGIIVIVPDDINDPTYTRAYYNYAHLIDPETNKGWQAVGDKIDEWNGSHKNDEQGFEDGDAPMVRFASVDAALKFAEWFEGENIRYDQQAAEPSALAKAYESMKAKHPDAILLFRSGNFYEAFGEDAKAVSEVLGITLTRRNAKDITAQMAGFPHQALDNYLPKLVRAGKRVAICDEPSAPQESAKKESK